MRLRVEDSETEAGQMGEAPVQRAQAGRAELPGAGRGPDPSGVCGRSRAAAALPRVDGLQEQGALLSERPRSCGGPGPRGATPGVR